MKREAFFRMTLRAAPQVCSNMAKLGDPRFPRTFAYCCVNTKGAFSLSAGQLQGKLTNAPDFLEVAHEVAKVNVKELSVAAEHDI